MYGLVVTPLSPLLPTLDDLRSLLGPPAPPTLMVFFLRIGPSGVGFRSGLGRVFLELAPRRPLPVAVLWPASPLPVAIIRGDCSGSPLGEGCRSGLIEAGSNPSA